MRFHRIDETTNIVVNTEEWVSQPSEAGFLFVEATSGNIGDTYSNGTFTPPTPVVVIPQSVSPRQARLALRAAGLLTSVNNAVATADQTTQIAWDYATEVRRDNPLIAAVAASLNPPLTSAQIDNLFITANTL